jgi:tetratricopeptide (TPR) repeat protein
MAMDRTDDARANSKAIETDPKNVTAHSAVVSLLMGRKIDEAAGHLDAMKKALPRHSQTLYLQASLAYAQKNYAAANEAIQLQLKAAPDNTPGLLLASAIDVQLKSYAQAEASSRRSQQSPQTSSRTGC